MLNALKNWPTTYQEALAVQARLQGRVKLTPLPRPPRYVAGADAICDQGDTRIFGAMAVYSYPELELVEETGVAGKCPFPYRTGLLSFREIPILAEVYAKLQHRPDVILADGQGIAHPRGLGLATHLGLVLNLPTIGVAKSRLIGEGEEPGRERGSTAALIWHGQQVGLILRTKTGVKPLYLSPGHLITLEESLIITLGCVGKYRLPLPVRQADHLTRQLRTIARRQENSGMPRPGD